MAGISKKRIKTKNGTVTKYTISYIDVFGKQHTSGIYDTKSEAKKDLDKFENVNPETQNITYGYIFNMFLERARLKYAFTTSEDYERYHKLYFQKFDDIKYEKIDAITWQNFFDNIEYNVSPYVAYNCLKMAKAAVNYLIRHDILQNNIFNKVDKITLPKADINLQSTRCCTF